MSSTIQAPSQTSLQPAAIATQTLAEASALINRSYLSELERFSVLEFNPDRGAINRASDVRIFRIERLVHSNRQSVLESTAAAYTALGAAGHAVFLFLRSNGTETELFIGTRSKPGSMLGHNAGELMRETFRGHFAGSLLQPLDARQVDALLDGVQEKGARDGATVTAVTGVPALSTENREHFMQGLERFIDAAENRVYQAIILAEPVDSPTLEQIRTGYELAATQLSPLLKQQISFGSQESDSVGRGISQSISQSLGESLGLTETRGTSDTVGASTTETRGTSETFTSQTAKSKIASFFPAILSGVGTSVGFGFGGPAGAAVGAEVGLFAGSAIATTFSEQYGNSSSHAISESRNESRTQSTSEAASQTRSVTSTSGVTDSKTLTRTAGSSRQITIEETNKSIAQLLAKIDSHLERIDEARTYGGWYSSAYFIGDGAATSTSLASLFLGLVRGNKSSQEDFALTTWQHEKRKGVIKWLGTLRHPRLQPDFTQRITINHLTPATLVSGKEMAIQLSLPRYSTSTVTVVETPTFGRRIQRQDGASSGKSEDHSLELGHIRHLWETLKQPVRLDLNQLSSHVFVSGSTGTGKSNALYGMLEQISAAGVPFLVIEPAKGEYRHVFGHRADVTVLGTHPEHSQLLRINPFRFPAKVHVLEHIDRLSEIFNVCWPMYAAMPAVLKDAILFAYRQCGWDLATSKNRYDDMLFPTFADLLDALGQVIGNSAWSQEVKGNYEGSLSMRVRSLTNGLNGQIFCTDEIDNALLFDSNMIVDLSRVGSSETKALIMGVLIMRLGEHRMAGEEMNHPLRHVTVLEEAHNILKNSSSDGGAEGVSVIGKAVEMLVNGIAEMRTYGEGFIIVDQSPHAVDIAAIRNTNTKIILRLPEETDRNLVGKSAALRDEQLGEISRLPRGVAVVYQNDWLEPVLCQIRQFKGKETRYTYQPPDDDATETEVFDRHLLNLLLARRVPSAARADLRVIADGLPRLTLPARFRVALYAALKEAQDGVPLTLWQPESFGVLARLVTEIFGCRADIQAATREADSFAALDVRLQKLVEGHVSDLASDVALSVRHCLVKDYSLQKEKNLDVYKAWCLEKEHV